MKVELTLPDADVCCTACFDRFFANDFANIVLYIIFAVEKNTNIRRFVWCNFYGCKDTHFRKIYQIFVELFSYLSKISYFIIYFIH